MKITKDKLPGGYIYPCTVSDIKNYLEKIPKADLEGIKSIRLSNQLANMDGEFHSDGRVKIIYFVDQNYRKPLKRWPCDKERKEWGKFNGIVKYLNGKYYVCWELEDLKRYIKFVLFHEVGHCVYYKKHGKFVGGSQTEKFCDEYAMKYLNAKH